MSKHYNNIGVKMKNKHILQEPFEEFKESEFADFEDEQAKTDLGKGLFWLVRTKQGSFQILCCKLLCFRDGVTIEEVETGFCENDGISHKDAWDKMQKDDTTKNKPYNYFPRGRVEIKKGKAIIYANPVLCNDSVINRIKESFGLTLSNGINKIKIKADNSRHYQFLMEI